MRPETIDVVIDFVVQDQIDLLRENTKLRKKMKKWKKRAKVAEELLLVAAFDQALRDWPNS